jgi:hypothetical protein
MRGRTVLFVLAGAASALRAQRFSTPRARVVAAERAASNGTLSAFRGI